MWWTNGLEILVPSQAGFFNLEESYVSKNYIHLTKEMNNKKCMSSSPRGIHIFDNAKGKMKHKLFLPLTLLYKRSYVPKAGSCLCQEGRSRSVCFEMWRMVPVQMADRTAAGGIRRIQDTFLILPRQESIQVYTRFNTLKLRWNCNFNYTFGIFEN